MTECAFTVADRQKAGCREIATDADLAAVAGITFTRVRIAGVVCPGCQATVPAEVSTSFDGDIDAYIAKGKTQAARECPEHQPMPGWADCDPSPLPPGRAVDQAARMRRHWNAWAGPTRDDTLAVAADMGIDPAAPMSEAQHSEFTQRMDRRIKERLESGTFPTGEAGPN